MAKFSEFGKHWLTQSLCPDFSPVSILLNTWLVLNYYLLNYCHVFKYMWLWYIIVTKWPLRVLLNLDFYVTGIVQVLSFLQWNAQAAMGNPKFSWLTTFLDVSHAVTKTPTKHTSQWVLLGNRLSFGRCLLCLSCPGEIMFQSRATCRPYCTSQKERYATKPAFLVLRVTAILGLDRVNKQTSDWTFAYWCGH